MFRKFCLSGAFFVTLLSVSSVSHAQLFFEADWLYYGRDNGSGKKIVTGPESKSLSDGGFDYTSGYRLTLGGAIGDVEIDSSFFQLDTWNDASSGSFSGEFISLDGDSIPGDPMAFSSLSSLTALSQAARFNPGMAGPTDETTESERLRSFSDPMFGTVPLTYATYNESNLRDFELNIGTRRNSNWWRFSVGYRHIKLDERSGLALGGVFDAFDIDDGNPFDGTMADDANNVLSHEALTNAGMSVIAGSGDGYDAFFVTADPMMAIGPDLMTYQMLGSSYNELNGAQVTSVLRIFDGEWVTIEGIGKAGIFRNSIRGNVQETIIGAGNDDSVYRRTFSDNETGAAFAGNLGIRGTVSLTDYINLIVGYDVLFLTGVALGSEQADGLSTDIFGATRYQVKNDGSLVAYGTNLGLEVLW